MSRAGYGDDLETWDLIRWRGAVNSALRGRRGQAFLREALAALEALPKPRLVAGEFEAEGAYCLLGAVARQRGVESQHLIGQVLEGDYRGVVETFGIADSMAREIMYMNDEGGPWEESDENRYARMVSWIRGRIREDQGQESAEGSGLG
jgi:hypothetical protein